MRGGRAFGLMLVLLLVATGCTAGTPTSSAGPPSDPPATELVHLDFEDRAAPVGAIVPSVANGGRADVSSEVSTYSGGRIVREYGQGSGYAIRFPEYAGVLGAPAAVLLIRARGTADPLSPGDRDFMFGADVLLDAESSGAASDNGDNVVQRGLYDDGIQYKLQIDHAVPSCRMAGTKGSAYVEAAAPIGRDEWHRLTCERSGDVVSLTVESLEAEGGLVEYAHVTAKLGAIDVSAKVPFSVGGKVAADGRVVSSATDQFNGAIDNVMYELLD